MGMLIKGIINYTPSEAFELCRDGAWIIDVREDYLAGFKQFDVQKCQYIPLTTIRSGSFSLPDDGSIMIFADSVGLRSREAVELLIAKGVTNIANLAGGISEWERDNLPVNTDTGARLTGSCMCQLKPREKKGGK